MDNDVYPKLKKAILEFDQKQATALAKRIVEENLDLIKSIDVITDSLSEIGAGFAQGDLFIPDLVGAAAAVSEATPIIEQALEERGTKRGASGKVVIGTVFGDIHSIGKDLVSSLLRAAGFVVYDIGINISPEEFVRSVERFEPDILALSALMTTTAPEQKRTIDTLIKKGIRNQIKIMVGGAAITQDFADSIGADGYEASAVGAVTLAKRLVYD
jgi:methanogenic corrinoid protein MtbC1